LLGGVIQPPTIPGALAYMGLSPEECGQDGTNYAWAYASEPAISAPAAGAV
jgi:toluene monooxygenase system protein A